MSSSHPYGPSRLRRILPWIYVVIFFILAPTIVFYTSGYRYNFKKGAVERNGTLIVDSTPGNAHVIVDGQDNGDKTPVTFQEMTPGWHHVEISKSGYGSWQQDVFVRAERVTFSNHIRLWKQGSPELVSTGNYTRLESDPARERILAFQEDASGTRVGWWSPNQQAKTVLLKRSNAATLPIRWRDDREAAMLGGTSSTSATWIVKATTGQTTAESLPAGSYTWSGNQLVGTDAQSQLTVDIDQQRIERTTLPTGVVEQSGSIELQTSTSTGRMLLADSSFLGRLFTLPDGNWSISEWHRPYLFLSSDNGEWLGVRMHLGEAPDTVRATGDYPRWSPDTKVPQAAFVNTYEIRLWSPDHPTTEIWRQSEALQDVVWNDDGGVLYAADAKHVFALPLDAQEDLHPVDLGDFDQVWDVAIQGTTIYVSASLHGVRGLYQLPGV